MNGRKDDKRTVGVKKTCKDCGESKLLDQFYKTSYARKHGTNSRMPYCIPCYSKRGKAYYDVHGERINARVAAKNRQSKLDDPVEWHKGRFAVHLKRTFGITVEQWEAMFAAQKGRCAICRKKLIRDDVGKVKNFGVDHNHTTLKIRKLLCHRCNMAIGLLDEDVVRLRRAIKYLNDHADTADV